MVRLHSPFLGIDKESAWWRDTMNWIDDMIREYGTVAWNYKHNQARRVYPYDGPWLFWLIRQANWDYFEATDAADIIRDSLINNGVPKKEFSHLGLIDRFYRLYQVILCEAVRGGYNTISEIWDSYRMELSRGNLLLQKPEEFNLPWEIDPYWGMEDGDLEIGLESEDREQEEIIPF